MPVNGKNQEITPWKVSTLFDAERTPFRSANDESPNGDAEQNPPEAADLRVKRQVVDHLVQAKPQTRCGYSENECIPRTRESRDSGGRHRRPQHTREERYPTFGQRL